VWIVSFIVKTKFSWRKRIKGKIKKEFLCKEKELAWYWNYLQYDFWQAQDLVGMWKQWFEFAEVSIVWWSK